MAGDGVCIEEPHGPRIYLLEPTGAKTEQKLQACSRRVEMVLTSPTVMAELDSFMPVSFAARE